ncbi:MAG: hypothetical protein HY747_00580 [Elusimicrobia bacterium]|nr:hypothetical protein [Elusimicrobiota bacterium]
MAAGGFVNLARLMGAGRRLKIGLGLLVFLPSVMSIASEAYFSFSADTRDMARRWMEKTALPGEKIFVTDPYDCPQLKMSRGQIERLLKRTEALGHPRKEYYRILLEGHPGGGYEIFYLRRSFTEAGDLKERVEKSYQAQDWIDVKGEGLDVLRNQGIKYAVVCGAAAQRYGQDKWFEEMKRSCPLSAGFSPLDKKIKGPSIEIYQVGGR